MADMDQASRDFLNRLNGMEQLGAAVSEMAAFVASYYLALIARGVPPESAAILAAGLQATMLTNARGQGQ
jgi:hypothetical protein